MLIIDDRTDAQNKVTKLVSDTRRCTALPKGECVPASASGQDSSYVVCEIKLPIADGHSVSRTLEEDRGCSPHLVIMLTAYGEQEYGWKGLHENIVDCDSNSIDVEDLRLRTDILVEIRRILRSRFNGYFYQEADFGNGFSERGNGFLKKLDAVMEKCFADPEFGIKQMASGMAIGHRQLQRKVKALTDHNPVECLRAYRLNKAVELLQNGMQVGVAAEATGFSSPTYFASCFKTQFGTTATEYQRNLR